MKIVLIQPPIEDFYQTSSRIQPIGLLYLAASLRWEGHEVEIWDLRLKKKRSIPVPQELSYLTDFYPFDDQSPFKLYSGYYHFGLEWDEIKKKIEESRADLFGISSLFTPYHQEALRVAQLIKEVNQRIKVVMGGSHISVNPAEVLRSPFVDLVLLGEGEERFPFLIRKYEKGELNKWDDIDGIGYRREGEIQINPLMSFIQDLDSLRFPARDLISLDYYRIHRKRATVIITSRGCPHQCAYCSIPIVMGSVFRSRSPENILKEMKECYQRFGIEVFDIEDDNLTFDLKRAKSMMRLILEHFGEGRLELFAMNGLSYASLDRELLEVMKKAGFQTINLSFVSKSQYSKERLHRPKPKEEFEEILREAEEVHLNVVAYAILGIPGQTLEEMVETLSYLMGKRVLIGPSFYYPTPGTPLFHYCKENRFLPPSPIQWRSTAIPIETEEFDRLDLVTLLRLVRVINFIKGKMDKGEIEEGVTWKDLYQFLKNFTPRNRDEIWKRLLLFLIEEGAFFSLREENNELTFVRERTSKKVIDFFFDQAFEKPILKARGNGKEILAEG
ncbi:MAG: B12-binding domain-containing radical SAM protein [Thermodesulfobacteriota bacterium]